VLASVDSPSGRLRVIDWKGSRYLTIDGGVHTIFNAETGEPLQTYVYAAELAADLSRDRGRLLLVGLGGGGAAEVFARRGWKVDAVEIDSAVVRLAGQFFRLRPFHAQVTVGDGRQYLRRSDQRYDAVFLDAFGSTSIPFHLMTREAFAQAKARLEPGGILLANVEVVGWRDPLASAMAATMRTQFRHVTVLPVSEPPNALGNVVLMASDRELDVPGDALGDPVGSLSDDDEHFRVLARHHAWENRFELLRGRVLTDDWNPCDLRAEEINLAARAWLRTQFPDSLLTD
jgi:spermidine synthase